MQKVETKIIQPAIAGLACIEVSLSGVYFFGLIRVKGGAMVIEYNARNG